MVDPLAQAQHKPMGRPLPVNRQPIYKFKQLPHHIRAVLRLYLPRALNSGHHDLAKGTYFAMLIADAEALSVFHQRAVLLQQSCKSIHALFEGEGDSEL